jgi:hypothetical protein
MNVNTATIEKVATTNANRISSEVLANVAVQSCYDRAPEAYTPAVKVLTRRLHSNEPIKYPAKKTRRQIRTGYILQLV